MVGGGEDLVRLVGEIISEKNCAFCDKRTKVLFINNILSTEKKVKIKYKNRIVAILWPKMAKYRLFFCFLIILKIYLEQIWLLCL